MPRSKRASCSWAAETIGTDLALAPGRRRSNSPVSPASVLPVLAHSSVRCLTGRALRRSRPTQGRAADVLKPIDIKWMGTMCTVLAWRAQPEPGSASVCTLPSSLRYAAPRHRVTRCQLAIDPTSCGSAANSTRKARTRKARRRSRCRITRAMRDCHWCCPRDAAARCLARRQPGHRQRPTHRPSTRVRWCRASRKDPPS